jgi:hypothetical protein
MEMNVFDDGIVSEIVKYLNPKNYLRARCVWRIPNDFLNDIQILENVEKIEKILGMHFYKDNIKINL